MNTSPKDAVKAPEQRPGPGGEREVTLAQAIRVWIRVAVLSFGGPAGQIAVMHRILVEEKRWVSENRFLHALNYCMLLPGPEAQQLATYIGWLLHGTVGGLIAGTLFVLPGFLAILALSVVYALFQGAGPVEALFFGLKPAVMAIVIEAVIRIGRRALKNAVMVGLAGAAFVAIFFFDVPFPFIILAAAVIGLVGGRLWPGVFQVIRGHSPAAESESVGPAISDDAPAHGRPSVMRTLRVLAVWLCLWLVPIALLMATRGRDDIFVKEGLFFSKAAVVTFGGAYAVLAYIAQEAVETHGWLEPGEMLDGLGMAETTPGPLIQVVQFVGFMGAYRHPSGLDPLLAGILGSVITMWVTFTPCFLWIFLGAPYIELLRGNRTLSAGLSAITAAVVGVVLNLGVWFSVHTMFSSVAEVPWMGVHLLIPDWSTLNPASAVIAVGAFVAIFRFKVGMMTTLGASVVAGLLWFLVTGST